MDFPSLQVITLSLVWLLVWCTGSDNSGFFAHLLAFAVFCVLIYQCWLVFPYTEMHALEIDSYMPELDGNRHSLKLMSCNVLMTNRDSARLLYFIETHQPDIFISLESDLWWEAQFDELKDYPYTLKCPLDNLYGMHIYSKYPLLDAAINFEVEADKPSMDVRVQVAENTHVHLYVVHPAPPAPAENTESTERDLELLTLAKHVANRKDRIIIAGDLNDVAWSATTRLFRQISGLLDPRVGRGLFNTFNAFHWYARWPLDHVFLSNHFKVQDIQRLPAMGSDHFPLLIELAIMNDTDDESLVSDAPLDEERLDSILTSTVSKELNS